MAILQEVDKCVRCNGCVISCKRTWHMLGDVPQSNGEWDAAEPHQTLAANQRVVIKSQKRVDMGPFVRFSCWHCENPPCVKRCPFQAITKQPSGAVAIDPSLCKPAQCGHQCKIDCQRGGVPMIGVGSDYPGVTDAHSWKCTLCTGGYTGAPYAGAGAGGDLPTKNVNFTTDGSGNKHYYSDLYSVVPGVTNAEVSDLAHQPSCVFTCPAKAMKYDTRANILAYLNDPNQGWLSHYGDGSMFWASKKYLVSPPKADPFIEDHVAPLVSSILSSPFAKAALAPTLVAGAVLAIAARRAKMDEELSMTGEER